VIRTIICAPLAEFGEGGPAAALADFDRNVNAFEAEIILAGCRPTCQLLTMGDRIAAVFLVANVAITAQGPSIEPITAEDFQRKLDGARRRR
jgi:hypothetical protein